MGVDRKNGKRTCLICEERPRHNGGKYCQQCGGSIASESRRNGQKPFRFIKYRDLTVAMVKAMDETYHPVPYTGNHVPQSKLIDLDSYVPGFTRDQVKRMKKAVLRVYGVGK